MLVIAVAFPNRTVARFEIHAARQSSSKRIGGGDLTVGHGEGSCKLAEKQRRGGLTVGQVGGVAVDPLPAVYNWLMLVAFSASAKTITEPSVHQTADVLSTVVRAQEDVVAHIAEVSTARQATVGDVHPIEIERSVLPTSATMTTWYQRSVLMEASEVATADVLVDGPTVA